MSAPEDLYMLRSICICSGVFVSALEYLYMLWSICVCSRVFVYAPMYLYLLQSICVSSGVFVSVPKFCTFMGSTDLHEIRSRILVLSLVEISSVGFYLFLIIF